MSNIALLISGQPRKWPHLVENHQQNIMIYRPDVFIYTSQQDTISYLDDEELLLAYDEDSLQKLANIYKPKSLFMGSPFYTRQQARAEWEQWRKLQTIYRDAINYKTYIRMRPDCKFRQQVILENIEPNTIYCHIRTANHNGQVGINDWFFYCDAIAAEKVMQLYMYKYQKTDKMNEEALYELVIENKINIKEIPLTWSLG